MKNYLLILLIFCCSAAQSQYYFNDLVGTAAINEKMKVYMENKVRSVTGTGYDPQGAKSTDFYEIQEVDYIQKKMKVSTRNGRDIGRQVFQFDSRQKLIGVMDSARGASSFTSYSYDANNNITSIKTVLSDSADGFAQSEEHQWFYNTSGKPEKMWRILNGKDSTEYRFTIDKNGNVADEQLIRRGVGIDSVFFYYDDNNRLTDIVRYNKKAKMLLPDFMFEYDDKDRVIQKITTLSTISREYLIWRYIYNDKGLRTKEALFNKDKALTGRIEYAYTTNP